MKLLASIIYLVLSNFQMQRTGLIWSDPSLAIDSFHALLKLNTSRLLIPTQSYNLVRLGQMHDSFHEAGHIQDFIGKPFPHKGKGSRSSHPCQHQRRVRVFRGWQTNITLQR